MIPEVEALAQRLEEVEKQVAHLAALVTELSDTDRIVTARSFVVRDETGKRRAELGMMIAAGETKERPSLGLFDHEDVRALLTLPEEGPLLQLTHPKTKAVVNIGVDENGPGIDLLDANGKRRVFVTVRETVSQVALFSSDGKRHLVLAVFPSGEPSLSMCDGNGKSRLALGLSSSGEPCLDMSDGNGSQRFSLALSPSGTSLGASPQVCFRDANGILRLMVENDPAHGPCLIMYDANAEPRLCIELTASGKPTLFMRDANGDTRMNLDVKSDGPCLAFGKDGKVFWSAP